jgi:branched-chain amino acid transport system ATP-binding protein
MSKIENEALLVARKITRRFGGLVANQDVCVDLMRGQVHVLLGPNGAGKSTCINMLSGDLPPSEGQILFMGKDITGLSAAQRSLVGIGRSYQRTNIFPAFTVLENVRLAAQSRNQQPWRLFSKAMEQRWALDKAVACIEEAGLGQQRQLEIAMVLATDAVVMLLDEPLAGMGSDESAKMVEVLKRLRQNRAILLVEHDMDAVFAVADTITVMVNGQVLESGPPAQIKASVAVQEAYLGQEDSFHV